MKIDLINATGYKRFVCPVCRMEKPAEQGMVVGVWWSPTMVLVCHYGVCSTCADQTIKLKDKSERQAVGDRTEAFLLERYPQLKNKLPPNYSGTDFVFPRQ